MLSDITKKYQIVYRNSLKSNEISVNNVKINVLHVENLMLTATGRKKSPECEYKIGMCLLYDCNNNR